MKTKKYYPDWVSNGKQAARKLFPMRSICTRRAGELYKALSRLYRSQISQVNNKYSRESSWRDLKDLHTFAYYESDLETMKSASRKRHPGEKHNPGEKLSWISSNICLYILQNSHIFCNRRPNFTNFDAKLSGPCQQPMFTENIEIS